MSVRGQVTVITGASSGIGRATARLFAKAGAKVALAARQAAELEALAAELRSGGAEVLVVPTDVADRAATAALVAQVVAQWHRVDVLINNAGVGIQANIAALPPAQLEQVFAVNFFGPINLIQAALPHMQHQRSGVIVNVSSPVAYIALPGISGYAASKAALDVISDTLRRELYGSGISVITVYPGRVATNFDRARLRVAGSQRVGRSPFAGSADRVALAILRGVEQKRRVVYALNPFERAFWIIHSLLPQVFDPLFGRRMARRGNG